MADGGKSSHGPTEAPARSLGPQRVVATDVCVCLLYPGIGSSFPAMVKMGEPAHAANFMKLPPRLGVSGRRAQKWCCGRG